MTASKQQNTETKTETKELSEAALSEASGGIIAVMPQNTQLCDGSVRPVTPQAQNALIGLLAKP